MRINRGITNNLGLMDSNERCLKSRGPIRLGWRQAYLGSSPMIATALLTELGSDSKRMKVEREKDNGEEKDRSDQATRFESSFHRGQ